MHLSLFLLLSLKLAILIFSQGVKEHQYYSLPFNLEFDDINSLPGNTEEEKILEQLSNPSLTINMYIGRPVQTIKMNINSTKYYMFFYHNTLDNDKIRGYDNTSDFYIKSKYPSVPDIDECIDVSEFQDHMAAMPEFEQSNYYLPLCEGLTNYAKNTVRNGGVIGMDCTPIDSSNTFNFVSCLHGRDYVRLYDFHFQYTTDKEGYLIIGAYPYRTVINQTEDNYIESKALVLNNRVRWSINIQIFSYNDKKYEFTEEPLQVLFKFEDYLITAPTYFYDIFKNEFFNSLIQEGKCFEKDYKNYTYFYCKSTGFKYDKMKKIKFQNMQQYPLNTSFIFDYKDLFQEYNNYKYFLIRFDKRPEVNNLIIFGQVFLRKYITSFNQNSKTILLSKNIDPDETFKVVVERKANLAVIIILVVLIIILLVMIGRFSYQRYIRKDRRIRANELQDEYIYENIKEIK